MINQISRLLMIATDAAIYFFIVQALVAYLLKTGLLITPKTFAIVIPAIAFLWGVTYLGTWLSISEKKRKQFLIAFLMFDVCPGLLGAATATMRTFYH